MYPLFAFTFLICRSLFLASALWGATAAQALTSDQALAIAHGETEARVAALAQAALTPDAATAAFLQALADDAVKVAGTQVFVMKGEQAVDPVTGAVLTLPADAEDVINNNLMRGELDNVLAGLQLRSPDAAVRKAAIKTLAGENAESRLPLIEQAFAVETVKGREV